MDIYSSFHDDGKQACPRCGQEFSSLRTRCPHCARLSHEQASSRRHRLKHVRAEHRESFVKNLGLSFVLLLVVALLFLALNLLV